MTRVTVLVPVYNREAFLPTCLGSIKAQTFADWRVVIADNASTDGSVRVATSFTADPRFEVLCRPVNVGYVRNTNLLLRDVETEFVAILHSDDWWEPDYLRRLIADLDQTGASMALSAVNYVVEGGRSSVKTLIPSGRAGTRVLPSAAATRLLIRTWPFLTPSDVVCRTELLRRLPAFDESMPLSTDWLMWLRAAAAGPVAICDRPLVSNRIHGGSVTGLAEEKAMWADEWIRLNATLEKEWSSAPPYPGAAKELRAVNAVRFAAKSYELHERGNSATALKLARLARETTPSRAVRAGALLLLGFVHLVPSSIAIRLRRFAAGLARRMARATPAGRDVGRRQSAVGDLLAMLKSSPS